MTGGGGVPPDPPPDDEHPVKTAAAKITTPRMGRIMRRRPRRAHGSITIAKMGGSDCHPPSQAGRSADELAWLVVICNVGVPVLSGATEILDGLNAHAAYDGSVPHCRVNVAGDPGDGVKLNK